MSVTAIVAAKNGMPWIITALESLAAQTRKLDQILVSIDSDTTDRTVLEIRQRWPAVTIVWGGYTGQARVFNAALTVATGEWVLMQDADDWSRADRLGRLLAYAIAHPEVGAVGSCVEFVWSASQPAENPYTREIRTVCDPVLHDAELREQMPTRLGGYFMPATMLVRRDVLAGLDGMDPSFTHPGYDLALRLLGATRIEKLPDRLYTYRLHHAQQTADRLARDAAYVRAQRRYLATL
jgi:GT2 family glycosyltransferase